MSPENAKIAGADRIVVAPKSASPRRSFDQRLLLRLPAVYRLLGGAFMRLPPRSRLRRLLLARLIGRAYAAANRRDFELVLLGWDPGSEYRPSVELMPPDLEAVFHGRDGYLRLWRYWLDAFDDIRWDPEEIVDVGDKVLVTAQQTGQGSGSGVSVSERVSQLFTLRHGLVIRQEDFLDRSQALEAAGLRLPDDEQRASGVNRPLRGPSPPGSEG